MRQSPRLRRLRSDHKALQSLANESSIFSFNAHGDPPELYVIRFAGRGLFKSDMLGDVQLQNLHEVHIRLGAAYPRMMPELAWKSPIFHPNISASGVVCLGGYGTYWVPSLTLDELCVMLWDMIRYENYDETSPYNREAAGWIKNQIHYRLPLDPRPLRDRKAGYAEPIAADIVADAPKFKGKVKKESSAGNRRGRSSAGTPPVRTEPAPRPVPPPVEPEVIFLDDGPSLPRPATVPAQAREEGGIVFIE
ncbi:MAG: hypothetical protein L0211_19495 [Planctomycetaceae bacterium]|nr:hypothetical protein [Planctomycetaceae bacterium]